MVKQDETQYVIRKEVQSTEFSFYTDQDVLERSVVEVTSPVSFDPNGTALPGGLYDPRLGSQDYNSPCITCAMHSKDCAGHSGHIVLKQPVYHPLLVLDILTILRTKCWNCHHTRAARSKVRVAAAKFVLLFQKDDDHHGLNEYHNLDIKIATAVDAATCGGGGEDGNDNVKDAAVDSVVDEILQNVTSRTPYLPTSYHAMQYTLLRNETIAFLRAANRCHHCGVYSPRLRQDGGSKIFRSPLSKKYQNLNAKEGLAKFRSALDEKNAYDSDDTGQGMSDDDDNEDDDDDDDENVVSKRDLYVSALEVEAHLKRYWTKEPLITSVLFGDRLKYILHVVPVPPVRFRPFMKLSGGMAKAEHAQAAALSSVMKVNETMEGNKAAIELQRFVNNFMDNSNDASAAMGIRQLLEKKNGLFRQNMMGKRVNYACRSVISPDLYVGSNEIGLPVHFCQVLTFPEAVNERNLGAMRSLVERGPANYPGARWVQLSFSSSDTSVNVIDLTKMNEGRRHAVSAQLATGCIVGRQLRDGDYVLMNRQPTLHKPGIMAHRVRVLYNPTQKTIRMHYANCNAYNADFDGDEMNCHFPQNQLTRAEAQYIANANEQYIVPTDGTPLRGLIQDHVVGGVKMTRKDCFLEKWEYQQLVFAALTSMSGIEIIGPSQRIHLLPPALRKPRELWTGKQVVSTLLYHLRIGTQGGKMLPGLSMERKAKTPDYAFGPEEMEHMVLIRDGELLRGVLDKAAFGATDFSMVHAVQEAYGSEKAGLLLNAIGKLFTAYIQFYSGHSCRMEDLVLSKESDAERRALVQRAYILGTRAAKAWADSDGGKIAIPSVMDEQNASTPLKAVAVAAAAAKIGALLTGNEGKDNFAALDSFMQGQLNPLSSEIVKKTLPDGLAVPFPYNTFGIMTSTGAKGSIVNQSQVSCLLGQQALEGRRVPRMSSGRTLPSFAPFDPNPRADGFVTDRFLTGIRPQEYYFHCMAGREGLVDTAVKTSRSGYLQRCLVKHLEDLKIGYDFSVRNSGGDVIQFLYGEDGLDPTKAAYLDCTPDSFEFFARNAAALDLRNPRLKNSNIVPAAKDHIQSMNVSRQFRMGDFVRARRLRTGNEWKRGALCTGWKSAIITKVDQKQKKLNLRYDEDGFEAKNVPVTTDFILPVKDGVQIASGRAVLVERCARDPVINAARRGQFIGQSGICISERVASQAHEALKNAKLKNILSLQNISDEVFSAVVGSKYSSSLCAPGEAVGSIAAQSIGEPSTQMTLNTFHLAGIPRLREVIMTASKSASTPTMSIPVRSWVTDQDAVRLARSFSKLTLMDFLAGEKGVAITERLEDDCGSWVRAYYVTLRFHPSERIEAAFGLTLEDIARSVGSLFLPALSKLMKKQLKLASATGETTDVRGGITGESFDVQDDEKSSGGKKKDTLEGDESDDDDENDDDSDDKEQHGKQMKTYEEDSDEESKSDSDQDSEDNATRRPAAASEEVGDESESTFLNTKSTPMVRKKQSEISLPSLKVEPDSTPLLMVGIVEDAAAATIVRHHKGIEEAFINEERGRGRCFQTAGVNFVDVWNLEQVEHDKLDSNDIWAIRRAYGVEAARNNIVIQIRNVFGVYGIEVDPRHLSLIADYMTFDGGYKAMSRGGMQDNHSALQQMSFETTASFLKFAALNGVTDKLVSPSASIVVGRPVKVGTGTFSLLSSM